MNNTKQLKAAVIGLGVGAHQARTLSAHTNSKLVWICDFDQEILTKIGSELKEAKQTLLKDFVFSLKITSLVCV